MLCSDISFAGPSDNTSGRWHNIEPNNTTAFPTNTVREFGSDLWGFEPSNRTR